MTREDALSKVSPYLSHIQEMKAPKKIKWIKKLVDEIYDDIESQVCENCKHYYAPELTTNIFRCKLDITCTDDYEVQKDFGCNRWEAK